MIKNYNYILKQNYTNVNINKYGRLRLNYLKNHNKSLYNILLMKDELTEHLLSVSKECELKYEFLMRQFKEKDERLSEKNKEINQLEWVKLMNNYKNCAEEIILNEIVFS